jgi:hypothetical protein
VSPSTRSRLATALLFAAAAAVAATVSAAEPAAIAHRMHDVMGGAAYDASRVLRFTWGVERDGQKVASWRHAWDRWTGDYRLEGVERDTGAPWVAFFNIDSKEGRVWIGDRELAGDELAAALEQAYGRFINDTYWLLMPWKWLDPGVNLTAQGAADVDGKTCDVVGLSFGAVGLTSNDRYLAYVDRDTGFMLRWSYVLQQDDGSPGTADPTVWNWEGWRQVPPGVWFAERKVKQGEGPPVAIVTEVEDLVQSPTDEQLAAWFRAR